jgi:hypothetical protein
MGKSLTPLTIASEDYAPVEVYCGLRDKILRLPRELPNQENTVVAALMETGHPGAVVTLVMVLDGTTSLYFSSGGGIIGAGAHPEVAMATRNFIQAAGESTPLMQPTKTFPLPRPSHTRFYVLLGSGIFSAEALEQDLGHHRHALSPLFHLGHAVIAMVRQHSPPSK